MLAQVYVEGNNCFVRIFKYYPFLKKIADLPKPNKKASVIEDADVALHNLHLYRNQKWKETDWGFEARIYFRV